MKSSTPHRALGHVALAADSVLTTVEGSLPSEGPLQHGQQLGPLSLLAGVVAALPAVILSPRQNRSTFEWWLFTHPFDRSLAGNLAGDGLAPWLPKLWLAWMKMQIATSLDN